MCGCSVVACTATKQWLPCYRRTSRALAVRADTRGGGLRGRIFVSQIGVEVNPELSDMRMKHWGCCDRKSELGSKVCLAFVHNGFFFVFGLIGPATHRGRHT